MSNGRYMGYSPSPSAPQSPHTSGIHSAATVIIEREKYLSELLEERSKLGPFVPVLPRCYRLLSQEILRVTALLGNASFLEQVGIEHASPLTSGRLFSNASAADINKWSSTFQPERLGMVRPTSGHGWLGSQGGSSSVIIKKTIRVDIPVDKYPNFNFVGRLLGPRGISLKRVEARTECRILIRGRGSIKDPNQEIKLICDGR